MAPNYDELVTRSLSLLRDGLNPYVLQTLKAHYRDNWWSAGVESYLTGTSGRAAQHARGSNEDRFEKLDVYVLLQIMIGHWPRVFQSRLDHIGRNYVGESLDVRNRAAHQEPFNLDSAQRGIDTIHRLLKLIAADQEATQVSAILTELLRLRVVESDKSAHQNPEPLQGFIAGLSGLPGNQIGNVQAFLDEYLGPPTNPVAFGGRQEPLNTLNRWLDDPTQPYALLVAPAGRGKSALLARWVAQVAAQPHRAHVAFLPISLRFNTASKNAALAVLGARLHHLHSATNNRPHDAELWSEEITRYICNDRPTDSSTLVIVIDGADEAIGWELGRDLRFPAQPGRGIKILISARTMADCDERGWLRRLGWEKRGQLLSLSLLDRAGVAEVLRSIDGSLTTLGMEFDLATELFRLSAGDPLLLQLYVAALQDQVEQTAFLTSIELHELRPGLEPYFERWWDDQRRQWGHNSPLREPAVRHILNLLACALGPLTLDDVLELGSQDQINTLTIEEALHSLNRFVIGDGKAQGYVFSHPRLSQYFYEKLSTRERTVWEERFLNYGKRVLDQLNQTPIDKHQLVSAYIVRTYRVHLERSGAEDEQFYELISEGWLRAWESIEGVYDGFLGDLNDVWQRVYLAGASASPVELGRLVGLQCRYALITASINSLTGNLSPELLAELVTHGIWSAAQALAYIQRNADEEQQSALFLALAPQVPIPQIAELLPKIRVAATGYELAKMLIELAKRLPESERSALLCEAYEIAKLLSNGVQRAKILTELLSDFPEINLQKTMSDALVSLVNPEDSTAQEHEALMWVIRLSDDLKWVMEHLPDSLVYDGLKVVEVLQKYSDPSEPLELIAPRMSASHLQKAIGFARAHESAGVRSRSFEVLIPHLSGLEREAVISEALENTRDLGLPSQSLALINLAPYFSEAHIQFALKLLRGLGTQWLLIDQRQQVFAALAVNLPHTMLSGLLQETRKILPLHERAPCLGILSTRFEKREQSALLDEAVATARSIKRHADRAKALIGIMQYLPSDQQIALLVEALSAARAIERWIDRKSVSEVMANFWEADASSEEKERRQSLVDFFYRPEATTAIAALMPLGDRAGIISEALADIRIACGSGEWIWFGDHSLLTQLATLGHLQEMLEVIRMLPAHQSSYRNATEDALEELIPRLAAHGVLDAIVPELLAVIARIAEPESRIAALLVLSYSVSVNRRTLVLLNALATARIINDAQDRVTTLVKLAPYLPEANRSAILATVIPLIPQIPEPYPKHASSQRHPQVQITSELIPYLPQELLPDVMAILSQLELDEFDRADILELVAKGASTSLVLELLREIDLVDTDFEWQWVDAIFVRLIQIGNIDQAMTVINARQDSYERAWLLMSLAAQMPALDRDALTALALEESQSISNAEQRCEVLAGLIPILSASDRRAAIDEILLIAVDIPTASNRAFLLGGIAKYIAEDDWHELFARILSITDRHSQSIVLTRFIPNIPGRLLGDAIQMAQGLPTAEHRCQTLTALAHRLTGDAQDEILEEALIAALDAIEADKTNPAVLLRQDEPNFRHPRCSLAALLIDLTSQLAPSSRHDALSIVQEMTQPNCKAEALVGLATLLPLNVLSEYIDAYRTLHHESFRAQALVAVVPDLPEALLDQVLVIANDIEDASLRARVIGSVSARMPPSMRHDLLAEMIGLARELEQPSVRAAVLIELAPYLSPQLLREALLDVHEISAPDSQAHALVRMIPYVPDNEREPLLAKTLDIAVTVLSHRWRVETLTLLAPQLARLSPVAHYPLLCETLDKLAHTSRSDLLANLRALTPSIAALGGQTALTEIAQAIVEVGQWFP